MSEPSMPMVDNVTKSIKSASSEFLLWTLKLLSAWVVGLTFAIVFQQAFGIGKFLFLFVMIIVLAIIMRLAKNWRWGGLVIFDLICTLIGLLLRMYIITAPGH